MNASIFINIYNDMYEICINIASALWKFATPVLVYTQ